MKKINLCFHFILFICASMFSLSGFADLPSGPTPVTEQKLEQQMEDIYNILNQKISPSVQDTASAMQQANTSLRRGLTGTSGVALANNSSDEQTFRNWTPTAQDLDMMVQKGLQTGSLADRIKYYNQKFPLPTVQQLNPNNPNGATANYGVFSAIATNAAFGVADKSFNNAGDIAQQINLLYMSIDRQDSLKQGLDLNSVILLKIAALQADLMRIQSQQLRMQAVSQQQSNTQRNFLSGFIQNVQ